MIELYFAATPNGLKAKLFLEEAQLPYRVIPVSLGKGEQFKPECLALSPNNIACYPWIVTYEAHGQNLADFPHLKRWFESMAARPAALRTYEGVENVHAPKQAISEEERDELFKQGAKIRA
ncbi:hypothetical protein [Dyella sp.]|uniref:hypothetical protein n=1 Tax=Dyella sp. TaxID=1869338 RepID=UPI002B4A49C2|nr:hypothetical protein [Dyella sp.]HKT27133.1 hypothetical protein [Dyella sp.]